MRRTHFYHKLVLCGICSLLFGYCKTPYDAPLKATQTNFLVVEGFIDGAAPTTIKLSRTRILSAGDTAISLKELNANVLIEDDHQNTYPLAEAGNGVYSNTNTLILNPARQYRLHISTSSAREYFSDFVPFKPSPLIDTIGWKFKDGGVQTYLNTHDPNDSTRYYRWEYNETWEVHSYYDSYIKYDAASNSVIPRTEQAYICWHSHNSTNILLGSSAKLSSDVINEMPFVYIEQHDERLSVLYSIWVKQYALDLKGYNFWQAMKSNTENVGSIFDPQPNQTPGNIHCRTDSSETVVGYIGAGNTFEKRVFINNHLMPPTWNIFPFCPTKIVPDNPDSLTFYFGTGALAPYANASTASGSPAFSASGIKCVDCTISGGINIKPPFWP
ncbi:MAG: DUF4249 domain-containing protein [Ginsengibacter sp.]